MLSRRHFWRYSVSFLPSAVVTLLNNYWASWGVYVRTQGNRFILLNEAAPDIVFASNRPSTLMNHSLLNYQLWFTTGVLGVIALLFLALGLRGLITHRPFLFPSRIMFRFDGARLPAEFPYAGPVDGR